MDQVLEQSQPADASSASGEREQQLQARIEQLEQERQRLAADLSRFRALIENSGEGFTLVAADGGILFTSPASHRLWGYTEDEVVGRSGFEFIHPDDISPTMEILARLAQQPGGRATAEYRLRHKDGRWRWIDSRGVNLLHEPAVQAIVVVYHDITDRKAAEQALHDSEQRFARFMHHLPGLAWIKDAAGRYVYVNEAAARVFGVSQPEIYGKSDADLFPSATAAQFQENDRRAMASGAGVQEIETLLHDDGIVHHSVVSKFPIPDPRRENVLIGGMAIDITERLQAEETVHALFRISERLSSTLDVESLLDTLVFEAMALVGAEGGCAGLYSADGLVTHKYHRQHGSERLDYTFPPMHGLPGWLIVNKRPYLTNDPASDPQILQELWCQRFGVHCALSTPILSTENEILGFFELHNKRGGFTTTDETRLTAVSQAAAIAIQNALAYRRLQRVQEALREGELRYRLVARAANDAIWDWDLATNDVTWNESIQKLFGWAIEQIGLDAAWWHDNIHPDDHQRVIQQIHEALERGTEVWHAEYRFRRADGTYADVLDRGHVVRDGAGNAVRMVGSIMDLSERKRAEKAVRDSESLYRAIGESIDYGVWVCDPSGRNIYASDSFLRLVGMTQQECSEFGWSKVLHPEDAEWTVAAWKECVRTQGNWDVEQRFLGVDGRYHPVLARGVPVRDDKGQVLYWAGINLDIGRLKDAEQALREADRRKDEFLATLSHELRNPLAPVRSSIAVLKAGSAAEMELAEARDVIDRQVAHMARLLDDLLDVSRITRGKLELRRERVELAAVVRLALETSRPPMERAGHQLTVSLPETPIWLDADPVRLEQVFSNLLNNAAKYTDRGGQIGLTARLLDCEVLVCVRDSGIGLTEEQLPRLFEMFSQVSSSLERSQGGLGIGLSLVRGLVELHGGQISAASEGLGKGSEFSVRLPVVDSAAAPAAPAAAEQQGFTALPGRKILVADDNHDAASMLALLLRLSGHEVEVAHDGREAVDTAAAFQPDVLLLDIGMPQMSGYDVARHIRRQPWGRTALLVALTGWGQEDDKRRAADAGFDHHLTKPVDPAALTKLLSSARSTSM
jgi:PAS domain S-box-containing protein